MWRKHLTTLTNRDAGYRDYQVLNVPRQNDEDYMAGWNAAAADHEDEIYRLEDEANGYMDAAEDREYDDDY